MNNFSIAIHGGAGTLVKGLMTPELEAEYKAALQNALTQGYSVLEKGGSEEPMELFKKFRGREPQVDALLRHSGIAA